MSLAFNGTTTSRLTRSGAVGFNTYPFSVAMWIKPATTGNLNAFLLRLEGSDDLGVLCDMQWGRKVCAWRTGGASFYSSSASPDPAAWHLVLVVYASATDRRVHYKSSVGNGYSDWVVWNLSNLTSMTVGLNYSGELAHLAMWRSALSASDYAALAAGALPSTVQSATLLDYWPLHTLAAAHTGVNGLVLTATNTTQGTSDPLMGPADTVPPTLAGSINVSNNTTGSSYTLAWPSGSDNAAVIAYEVSLDGGANYFSVGLALGASVTGRAPGTTDAVLVRARDAAGNVSSPPLAASVLLPVLAGDTTPPVLTGTIGVTGLTSTGYTLSWPAGSDNVAVTSYERSLDAGATWADVGSALSVAVGSRAPGTTDQVRVRARDAAGNVSSPALSATVTLPGTATAALVTPPLCNNTGTVLANVNGIAVNVYNASTGVLVVRKTGLTSSAGGVVTVTDAALVSGTSYAYEVVTPAHGRRLPIGNIS